MKLLDISYPHDHPNKVFWVDTVWRVWLEAAGVKSAAQTRIFPLWYGGKLKLVVPLDKLREASHCYEWEIAQELLRPDNREPFIIHSFSFSPYPSRRARVFEAINDERAYQDQKWGTIEEHPHSVAEWLLIMKGELAEAMDAWVKAPGDCEALREILQVVAVGVACLEQLSHPTESLKREAQCRPSDTLEVAALRKRLEAWKRAAQTKDMEAWQYLRDLGEI
jgi:hypothetical protein